MPNSPNFALFVFLMFSNLLFLIIVLNSYPPPPPTGPTNYLFYSLLYPSVYATKRGGDAYLKTKDTHYTTDNNRIIIRKSI